MAKGELVFVLKKGADRADIGAAYDDVTSPCEVCANEDWCLSATGADEYFCKFAQAFAKAYDQFEKKVKKLVKKHAGTENRPA